MRNSSAMQKMKKQAVHACVLKTVFSFSEMCGTHISRRQELRSSGQPAKQAVCGLHG